MIVNGKYLGLSSVVKTFKYYFAPLIDSFSYHFEKKTCTRLKQALVCDSRLSFYLLTYFNQ